ncbi:MAG: helix-turn-helix domain-containing protein [Actinomycetota bacterium]|nr:helix-turn-helix domain-containing protein [Actinomycetota bacterium]
MVDKARAARQREQAGELQEAEVTRPAPGHDRLRLIGAREAARFLGLSLDELYRMRERGEGPPGYRIGRHIRFRWTDLHAWQQRHPTR